jgi:hypothetical protein
MLFTFSDRFFKNRYEEILTEQEMHVRQIVKKVIKTCSDKDCFTEAVEVSHILLVKNKCLLLVCITLWYS